MNTDKYRWGGIFMGFLERTCRSVENFNLIAARSALIRIYLCSSVVQFFNHGLLFFRALSRVSRSIFFFEPTGRYRSLGQAQDLPLQVLFASIRVNSRALFFSLPSRQFGANLFLIVLSLEVQRFSFSWCQRKCLAGELEIVDQE